MNGYTETSPPLWKLGKKDPLYVLKVCQQPERARLCSYKEENETIDRRPVDPPPVVEVHVYNCDVSELLESAGFFIRATIVHASPEASIGIPPNSYYLPVKTPTGMDAATGDIIQTPEKLKALDGRSGALCIFAKLSVRMPGIFRLKFTLYETSTLGIAEATSVVSDPFEVFSPKLFKGMRESTPLTRHLAAQGIKVKLRTDTSVGRQSESRRRPHSSISSSGPSHRRSASSNSMSPPQSRIATLQRSPLAQTAIPSRQSLVWRPAYHPPLADIAESNIGRASPDPLAENIEFGKRPKKYGDDGMVPSISDVSSRFDFTTPLPASDLSAFSLSHASSSSDPSRRSELNGHLTPALSTDRSPTTSSSGERFLLTHSGSNTLPTPVSLTTRTSSARSETWGMAPFFNRFDPGPGDDGIPRFPSPSPSRSIANFILPMPNKVTNLLSSNTASPAKGFAALPPTLPTSLPPIHR